MKIQGVNLGNWLVLEKWMNPSLFAGVSGEDENDFYNSLKDRAWERIKQHRDHWITEKDFESMAGHGCTLVRIPVPYTIFGDFSHRSGCIEYLDQAFDWAEKWGLKILVDLHTVPGGQNGLDNGGICGLCTWHQNQESVDLTLQILEKIAKRYSGHPAFWGLEPVNEPANELMFRVMSRGCGPDYQENLSKSSAVPTDFLRDFYLKCYDRLTPLLAGNTKLVFHDGFRLSEWDDFMPASEYPDVWIDTHMYINFARYELKNDSVEEYAEYVREKFADALIRAGEYHPVLVGEWSLALHSSEAEAADQAEKTRIYRYLAEVQKDAWKYAGGDIYWSYKTEDCVNPHWSFCRAKKLGYL